ncbi:hypothetical protein GF391_01990 [Candidatus Uhrbacteria bacterium]|nr:hypothetical protein [Candidatus Uhrbacteria bacterium]
MYISKLLQPKNGGLKMKKNTLIKATEKHRKEERKPQITNPLPTRPRPYYILDGRVIFDYEEALEAKESEKHNR